MGFGMFIGARGRKLPSQGDSSDLPTRHPIAVSETVPHVIT